MALSVSISDSPVLLARSLLTEGMEDLIAGVLSIEKEDTS